MILTGNRHNSNQYYIQEKVLSIFCWVSGNDMFIESFESRSPDEWVDLIKTLNREKLEPGAVSCRNWQSRKLGFREPELTWRVESLYLIVRAGDERERERSAVTCS